MNGHILGLLAETSIHPGSGTDTGVIDLPVTREAATDYPVITGSSLKGALRDAARGKKLDSDEINRIFGHEKPSAEASAGQMLVSDARLMLLPVRSLNGAYKWTVCPHIIERLRRDMARAGLNRRLEVPSVSKGEALASAQDGLFLEERQFKAVRKPPEDVVQALQFLICHPNSRERVGSQLAILHDDDFAWFARYGLPVQARNVLDKKTKQSLNLWYEETLPADTLLYCFLAERSDGADLTGILGKLFPDERPYLQAGGNETIGQGWFAVQLLAADRGESQ